MSELSELYDDFKKKDYDVYFEMYGKKMKVTVWANDESHAKEMVKEKIIFHKIEKSKNEFNEATNEMRDFFNGLGIKTEW